MRGLALFVAAAVTLPAQIKFSRLESPHFELYTEGSKGRATDILEHFERVRSFFAQTVADVKPQRKPKVVVLNSARSFAAFVEGKMTVAYYTGLPHRDQVHSWTVGRRRAEFLDELTPGRRPRILAVGILPFRHRPGPGVLTRPERPTWMDDEHLHVPLGEAVQQQSGAQFRHWVHLTGHRPGPPAVGGTRWRMLVA